MSGLTVTGPNRAPRARTPSRRRGDRRRLPLLLLVPLLMFGGFFAITRPGTNAHFRPIRGDGLGYYAWTAAILHADFRFCQWDRLADNAALSARNPSHPGRCEDQYAPGLAVLRLPVMAPVALMAGTETDRALDISDAEESANQACGLAALIACALLMWATLRRLGVGRRVAQLTVLAMVFGTGLFDYGVFDSSYSHVYSAALFAGLLYCGIAARQRGRAPNALLTFGLSLFIAWIRQPDIFPLALVAAAWLWCDTRSLAVRPRLAGAARRAAPVVLAIVCVIVFQVLYNRWSAGVWTLNSYGGERFSLTEGKELAVLSSADHGLFTWYPVAALALAVGLWRRPSRPWAWLAAGVIALLTIVYGSWDAWDLATGMGIRGMVDIVPVIALPAGIGLMSLSRRARWGALAVAALLTVVTLELTYGYWTYTVPGAGVTPSEYWQQVVGHHSLLQA